MVASTPYYRKGMRSASRSKATEADWPTMNRSIKSMCNPWFVPASIQLGKYVVGLANPFQNNLPLVPWL
jgi:hypothetical protein